MATDFKRGDHVEWNSEAGRVRGTIQKKVTTTEIVFKGYKRHASKEEPQYIQERQDRPPGHPQGVGPQEDQEKQRLTRPMFSTASFLALVAAVAVLAGAIASVSGFGRGPHRLGHAPGVGLSSHRRGVGVVSRCLTYSDSG
jgi:hypothetical protein